MQPQIYPQNEHLIPTTKIDHHAFYIIEKLKQNGHEAYLVGGGVRDLLMDAIPKDFDISTSARPEEVKRLFPSCILIGRRFRLAHIRFGKKIIEVSTFRAGDIEESKLIVQDNLWGSPQEDAMRRDFTINGLFYDPEKETVIDFVEGMADIKEKTLRTIGSPEKRFIQDPVRMIRLLKFQARFGFHIAAETQLALQNSREEIRNSSQARIFEELLKMLESGHAKKFFSLLDENGFLRILMPWLQKSPLKTEALGLLEEFDAKAMQHSILQGNRILPLSCLIYPLLHEELKKHDPERTHLGVIADIANTLINELFLPFFQVPRRMKALMISMLISQYRMTPLRENPHRRLRMPRDPDFPDALPLLFLRMQKEPNLASVYRQWEELLSHHKPAPRKGTNEKRHFNRRRRT